MRLPIAVTIAALVCLGTGALGQQAGSASPLTLAQAVQIALEKNPARKASLADTKSALADVQTARSFLLPHLTFSETGMRGNDPVYVFGSKLRQQQFSSADFALNQLNTPTPFGNFTTRFGGTWNLFDSFSSWRGMSRAKQMQQVAAHGLDWTDQEIEFRVIRTYYAVLLAEKQLEVAIQAQKTAQSIMERSQARFDSGQVVESDLLTAKVRLAGREQELIQARNMQELARAELSTAMGLPAGSAFDLTATLSERALPSPALEDLEKQALSKRSDLQSISAQQAAQRQSVAIAKSSFGPRVNAFAGWEMDNPTLFAGGGGNNWLGGVELQFDLFQGGAKRAELSRQRAMEDKIAAMKQNASDQVQLEVRRAYYQTDASRQQVGVARAAVDQAQASLRISQDRYDSGLITITDLLGTEEAAYRSQIDYYEAIYRFQTSYANLEFASGTLGPQSPVVMQ